jgi:phage N-6-adenine-methyltransferase
MAARHPLEVHFSSARGDWPTPQAFFNELNAEFDFTLDVCASASNAKCRRYFTRGVNALSQSWADERCSMNPPYGRGIEAWMKKAFESSLDGALVVCLVPARTDTVWWHTYAAKATEMRFVRGRLRFGDAQSCAPFPSAVLVFQPRRDERQRWMVCTARCCGFGSNA